MPGAPPPASLGPWLRPALMVGGSLVVMEALGHLLPADPGSLLGLGAMAGGWWLLSRGRGRTVPRLPSTLAGWITRCEGLLESFENLEGGSSPTLVERRLQLEQVASEAQVRGLRLAFVSSRPPAASLRPDFAAALRNPLGLRLDWGHPLPPTSETWQWPEDFARADALLHHIGLPLRATDLRWLEALPPTQPVWLLVEGGENADPRGLGDELVNLWPAADPQRILIWNGSHETLPSSLGPLAAWLAREGAALRSSTPVRCLEQIHGRWQAELERLRRSEWLRLQQRTQWLVAAGVMVAPVPSLDLLVLAAANGLMLQQMARLWNCSWSLDQLRAAALELGRASLALGVVEWSTQTLTAALKLHGATWLVGGAVQALSAAYLTRVVGHAMADVLALAAGVSEPDLEAIKRQAPVLVARAAEAERLDWAGFLQQGRLWLQQQRPGQPLPSSP